MSSSNPHLEEARAAVAKLKVGADLYTLRGEPVTITGETSQTWILGKHHKVKKAILRETGRDSGINDAQLFAWRQDALDFSYWSRNRYQIAKAVENHPDGGLLRKIAEMVGWEEPDDK